MTKLPLDFTFCTGQRCEIRDTCLRYTERLNVPKDRSISIAEFSDWDGSCKNDMRIEKDD